MTYQCNECGGLCDPGELSGGVCWDCREELKEKKRREEETLKMLARSIAEQSDGQLVLCI